MTFDPRATGREPSRLADTMFVHDFIHIAVPYPLARAQVTTTGCSCLVDSGGKAYRDGERLLMRVGVNDSSAMLSKRVEVTLGLPYPRGDATVVPIFWVATGASSLFPSLEGDLEVAPLPNGDTQLSLQATYEPPLGIFGRGMDRVLLHGVAEATVRTFLYHVSDALKRVLPSDESVDVQFSA